MADRTPTLKESARWRLDPSLSRFVDNPSKCIGCIRQLEFCARKSFLHPSNHTHQHHRQPQTRTHRRATHMHRRTTAQTSSVTSVDQFPSQIRSTRFRSAIALKTFPHERIRSMFQLPCHSTTTTSSSSHKAWATAAQATTAPIQHTGTKDIRRLALVSPRFTATSKPRVAR